MLTKTEIKIAQQTGARLSFTKALARQAFISTADDRVTGTHDLGANGSLVYVMEARRDNPNTYSDHWVHVLPRGGRQEFHGLDRDTIAAQLIARSLPN